MFSEHRYADAMWASWIKERAASVYGRRPSRGSPVPTTTLSIVCAHPGSAACEPYYRNVSYFTYVLIYSTINLLTYRFY